MDKDYYKILGVERSASDDDIQKAYRALARKYHPDLSENKEQAKEKFQEIQHVYDVLKDPEKRQLYDQYGENFDNIAKAHAAGGGGGGDMPYDFDFSTLFGGGHPGGGHPGGGGFEDIFAQFGGGDPRGSRRRSRKAQPRRGRDLEHELTVSFDTAVNGGKATLTKRSAAGQPEVITVTIPAGIEDGKRIRLKEQGEQSATNGRPGDLLIRVQVAPHPYFERRGKNLLVKIPVTFDEAWIGAKIDVPTPEGTVTVTVPPGSSGGRKLRVRGQGVKSSTDERGDLIIELQIQLPDQPDDASIEEVKKLRERHSMPNPRANISW